MSHGKGDHRRSYAHAIPGTEYVKRYEQAFQAESPPDLTARRICFDCKADKPSGKWCTACDRDTDSERVYE